MEIMSVCFLWCFELVIYPEHCLCTGKWTVTMLTQAADYVKFGDSVTAMASPVTITSVATETDSNCLVASAFTWYALCCLLPLILCALFDADGLIFAFSVLSDQRSNIQGDDSWAVPRCR